jgi:hypothetical protein
VIAKSNQYEVDGVGVANARNAGADAQPAGANAGNAVVTREAKPAIATSQAGPQIEPRVRWASLLDLV